MNFELLKQVGPIGQLIFLMLLLLSFFSWSLIFSKKKQFQIQKKDNKRFFELFQTEREDHIEDLWMTAQEMSKTCSFAIFFKRGMEELQQQREFSKSPQPLSLQEKMNEFSIILDQSQREEYHLLEKGLNHFATIASTAPFLGLFGTVWGIMNAFQKIGHTGTAHLSVVAPGISEALVTTAMGIAVSIPAVVAYNHFSHHLKEWLFESETFNQKFTEWVQHHLRKQEF